MRSIATSIIKNILDGEADRLDGPIGPAQYGYDPAYAKTKPFHSLRSGEGEGNS